MREQQLELEIQRLRHALAAAQSAMKDFNQHHKPQDWSKEQQRLQQRVQLRVKDGAPDTAGADRAAAPDVDGASAQRGSAPSALQPSGSVRQGLGGGSFRQSPPGSFRAPPAQLSGSFRAPPSQLSGSFRQAPSGATNGSNVTPPVLSGHVSSIPPY